MAKKTIDTKRNLCDSCKFQFPDCDGDPVFGDSIGNDNIIMCKQYKKPNVIFKRVEKGSPYWWFDINFKTNSRIESDSDLDRIYSRNGNYYYNQEDCDTAAISAKEYQLNKNK